MAAERSRRSTRSLPTGSTSSTAGRCKLPPKQAEKLDAGELAIDAQGDILYHRLKQTPQILVVGPISPDRNP
jgi:hypothetical protein